MNENPLPGLYVHVPFCNSKCPYCDFYSVTATSLIPAWLNALEKEAHFYKDRFEAFDTLYLGGGTPTILDDRQLTLLMETILHAFHFASDVEITIEANPEGVTPERLNHLMELGIGRISLGVQSFDQDDLSFLGRRHAVRDAGEVLERIRSAGVANLGVDLMYGFPGQVEEKWLHTLQKTLSYKPEHLSCYQLTFEKGTKFGQMKEKGLIRPLDKKEAGNLFLLTSRFLEENGYIHYEISNFALKEEYRSRHNQKYWRHVPYLGLGPSAHSFEAGVRWWNVRSVKVYCQKLNQGKAPVEGRENLSEEQLGLERVYLGLRTREGIGLSDIDDHPRLGPILNQLLGTGLVMLIEGRIVPTVEGFLVADSLPLQLVD
ncbi:MAG: radical SAM family heme chaperone HemW [Deltaproteobacteria bacterium]|nr:radical SAM family heme chaperone HemW [Deltaproteobacteria bacterium]